MPKNFPSLSYIVLSEDAGSLDGQYSSKNYIIKPAAGIYVKEFPTTLKFVLSLAFVNIEIEETYELKTRLTTPNGDSMEGVIEVPKTDERSIGFGVPVELEATTKGQYKFEVYLNECSMASIAIDIRSRG